MRREMGEKGYERCKDEKIKKQWRRSWCLDVNEQGCSDQKTFLVMANDYKNYTKMGVTDRGASWVCFVCVVCVFYCVTLCMNLPQA